MEITCGLVHASYSLPESQTVKLTFFAPWRCIFQTLQIEKIKSRTYTMSEKQHKISKNAIYQKKRNVIVRNNPAFDRHDFVPSQNHLHCTFGLRCNAQHQYTKLLARPLMIALQVVRTSFPFRLRECMGSNFPPPPPCVHTTYRLVTYRPFRHYALLSKHKEMRMRLGWTISYK